jgi:hypothetical protein
MPARFRNASTSRLVAVAAIGAALSNLAGANPNERLSCRRTPAVQKSAKPLQTTDIVHSQLRRACTKAFFSANQIGLCFIKHLEPAEEGTA